MSESLSGSCARVSVRVFVWMLAVHVHAIAKGVCLQRVCLTLNVCVSVFVCVCVCE